VLLLGRVSLMTAVDAPAWLDYGPAEFDARRLPKGYRRPAAEQGNLFFAAVPPKTVKAPALPPELPGQDALFGDES
jgi:hypothetical protein